MQKFQTGLLPGRFQPLHKGHIAAIKWSLARCGRLIVMAGSAQESRTRKNPFTARERIRMLRLSLPPFLLARCRIIPLPDIPDDSEWVSHLQKHLPHFDIVFSANPLVHKLVKQRHIPLLAPPYLFRAELEGAKIRKLMFAEKEWRNRVPPAVSGFLTREKMQKILTESA